MTSKPRPSASTITSVSVISTSLSCVTTNCALMHIWWAVWPGLVLAVATFIFATYLGWRRWLWRPRDHVSAH